jgi:hypothetical protein
MGNDGTPLTADYLENGDFPIFKIYDSSEGKYINTDVSIITIAGQEYTGWINFPSELSYILNIGKSPFSK